MEPGEQRGWRTIVDGESRPTSRGRGDVEVLTAAARSTLVVDFGTGSVKAAVAYHDRDRIAHLHGAPAYLLQNMFGAWDDYFTPDAAACVLDRICHAAASLRAGLHPTELWLTHPGEVHDSRVNALAQAARSAGFDTPTYMAEPLAAAACFDGLGAGVGEYLGVLDFGHTRFDATLLQRTSAGHEVIAEWAPADRPSAVTIAEHLYDVVLNKLAAAQRRRLQGDDALAGAIRRELQGEPLFWGQDSPQQRRLNLPAPVGGAIDLSRGEFVGALSAAIAATVDGLTGAARQSGVEPEDIAVVYLAGGLAGSDLAGALVAQRLGQVPICISDGNAVALGAANGCLAPPARGVHHTDGRDRVPRLYSPRRLMPTVCIDDHGDPCPDVVILERNGSAATRQHGTWYAGLRFSFRVIADMYPVEDDAERFALMDDAAHVLDPPPDDGRPTS